jgi:hypothetical protein
MTWRTDLESRAARARELAHELEARVETDVRARVGAAAGAPAHAQPPHEEEHETTPAPPPAPLLIAMAARDGLDRAALRASALREQARPALGAAAKVLAPSPADVLPAGEKVMDRAASFNAHGIAVQEKTVERGLHAVGVGPDPARGTWSYRAVDALENKTHVNVDDELAKRQAAAEVVTVVAGSVALFELAAGGMAVAAGAEGAGVSLGAAGVTASSGTGTAAVVSRLGAAVFAEKILQDGKELWTGKRMTMEEKAIGHGIALATAGTAEAGAPLILDFARPGLIAARG